MVLFTATFLLSISIVVCPRCELGAGLSRTIIVCTERQEEPLVETAEPVIKCTQYLPKVID